MIAFVLILILMLYVISAFVSSQTYVKRGKEYSTALYLSQSKMEQLQVTPIADIAASTGSFPSPFDQYNFEVVINPWEGELRQVEVRVTSPRGAVAKILTLRQMQTFQGIAVDHATNRVVYSKPASNELSLWDDITAASRPPTLAIPGGEIGGVAGVPGFNYLMATSTTTNAIVPYREDNPTPWGAPIGFPTVPGLGTVRIAGIAMDAMGSLVFCADWSNRGIWIRVDGIPGLTNGWRGGRPLAPTSPPLGIPSGLWTNATGSVLWVADTENQCLRKLFINFADPTALPNGYPANELEIAPGVGFWLQQRYRFPNGMGAPQGVTADSNAWAIYTIDRAYLYRMVEPNPGTTNWSRFPVPTDLSDAGPSGLALDEFNNLLYISTKNGELWKYQLGSNTFTRLSP